MTATMNRRHYTKPAMRVVELQHQGIICTSGFGATRNGYGTASIGDGTEQEWD